MSSPTDVTLVITDESNLRQWRTELPNIIDDLGLDPYQRALYGHYKRVCGAAGGTCTQGVRRVADDTEMSTAKVSLARRELAKKGLIIEHPQEPGPGHKHGKVFVTMVDIWRLNFLYYSFKKRPNIKGWTVAEIEAWTDTVYVVNGDDEEQDADRLPDKRPVYGVNGEGDADRLSGKQKKEHGSSKKELGKKVGADAPKRPPTGRNAIKAELESHFCNETKRQPPKADTQKQRKSAGQLWWNPLLEIYDACGDLDTAREVIAWAVEEMDRENLTIFNPNSIVKVAVAEIAKRERVNGRKTTRAGTTRPQAQGERRGAPASGNSSGAGDGTEVLPGITAGQLSDAAAYLTQAARDAAG